MAPRTLPPGHLLALAERSRPFRLEEAHLPLRTGQGAAVCFRPQGRTYASLVLAHGAGNDKWYSFAPLIEAALRRGFQVVSFDLPGHGAGNTSVLASAHAVADFAEALQMAREAFGGYELPWAVLGNSLGGVLALRAVMEGLLSPYGLALLGAPAGLHVGLGTYLREALSLVSAPMWRYRRYVASWREVVPAFGDFRREEFPVRTDGTPYLDLVEHLINQPLLGGSPACALLIAQGRRDAIADLEETRARAAWLHARGARVELEVLPGVGHLDLMVSRRLIERVLGWAWRETVAVSR